MICFCWDATWLGKKVPVFKKGKQIWMIQLSSTIPCVPRIPSVATLLTLATSFGDGCCAQNKSVSKSKRLLEHKAHRLDLLLNFFSNAGQQKQIQIQIQKVVDASRLDLFLNPFPNCQHQAWAWICWICFSTPFQIVKTKQRLGLDANY